MALKPSSSESRPVRGETIEIDWPLYNRRSRHRASRQGAGGAEAMLRGDGIVFATPEYNYGISGVLKNAIDWRRA